MLIDPTQIELSPQQRVYVARQAELLGTPWSELLEQLVPAVVEEGELATDESAYDAAKRLGLIGGIRSGHSDLSTNPDHMEGFGRD